MQSMKVRTERVAAQNCSKGRPGAARQEPTPSPCTQGEGRGEGSSMGSCVTAKKMHPLPNPLPEYRERERKRAIVEAIEPRRLFANSIYAFPGGDGHMLYQPQPLGDHIQDYSTAGYMGGTVPIPDVPIKATVSPVAGDDASTIQAAINSVAALPLDPNGLRGAVYLNPGTYEIGTSISI